MHVHSSRHVKDKKAKGDARCICMSCMCMHTRGRTVHLHVMYVHAYKGMHLERSHASGSACEPLHSRCAGLGAPGRGRGVTMRSVVLLAYLRSVAPYLHSSHTCTHPVHCAALACRLGSAPSAVAWRQLMRSSRARPLQL